MKIVTDSAANLSAERAAALGVEVAPFLITFMEKHYRDGVDISPAMLYRLYDENPQEYCQTAQPLAGDFVRIFEQYKEEEIISIHLSSGLSGAYSSAQSAVRPEDAGRITVIDSRTVGPALGWLVQIAARGVQRGWSKEQILQTVRQARENMLTMVSFSDIKYLRKSGRVSHLKSIVAALLHIKPIIGMNEEDGRYSFLGQGLTQRRVTHQMASIVERQFGAQKLHLQLMHGNNVAGAEVLRETLRSTIDFVEDKLVEVTPVLGAHAGPTVTGLAAMPEKLYQDWIVA